MSAGPNGLAAVGITFFDSMVKAAYHQKSMLRSTVYNKVNMGADTFKFPTVGRGVTAQHTPHQLITPMGIQFGFKTATPTDYVGAEYSNIFDQAKTNVQEEKELAGAIANAVERRDDQEIIAACVAATMASGHTVTTNEGGSDTALNAKKIRAAARVLDDKGVPEDGRCFVQSVKGKERLMDETSVTSTDFVATQALATGQLKEWMGFTFKWIAHGAGVRPEGGLPIASNVRDGFAYHRDAIGYGILIEGTVRKDYIAERLSWLIAQPFSAGGVVRDLDGIVKVQATEAA
jgi:hypothetical protein